MNAEILARVVRAYSGSDGEATKALYDELTALGPAGLVATNLFRAHKSSIRAKVYRRGSSRRAAYDRKDWSIENLAIALSEHAEAFGVPWGWGIDDKQPFHKLVLYVDLPTGQVSFHTATRYRGPDYPGTWDGVPHQGADRICRWAARLLSPTQAVAA